MRRCPFRACGKKIHDKLFACSTHWFRLTLKQRETINTSYAKYCEGVIGVEELRTIQEGVLVENQGV